MGVITIVTICVTREEDKKKNTYLDKVISSSFFGAFFPPMMMMMMDDLFYGWCGVTFSFWIDENGRWSLSSFVRSVGRGKVVCCVLCVQVLDLCVKQNKDLFFFVEFTVVTVPTNKLFLHSTVVNNREIERFLFLPCLSPLFLSFFFLFALLFPYASSVLFVVLLAPPSLYFDIQRIEKKEEAK